MRILFRALLVFFGIAVVGATASFADLGWFWQNPLPQGSALWAVSVMDSDSVIAVGEVGTILRTTDGGATWTQQTSGTTNSLYGVSFVDANTGLAVGDRGTILRTTDGGASWTQQMSGTTNTLNGVSFVDANTGTAVGNGSDHAGRLYGLILRTTDGGDTWTPQSSGTTNWLQGVSFVDAKIGTAVGSNGTILRTTTGGEASGRP